MRNILLFMLSTLPYGKVDFLGELSVPQTPLHS